MRLAHVTDLHFGAEDPDVVAALRSDLADQAPDRLLVSGDLTMRARAGQFRAARTLLESVGRPWTSVPGNHDVPLDRVSRAVRPLAAYRRFVDAQPQPVLRADGLHVLGLSTARPYLWKGGRIDAGQVALVGAAFAGPARLKVLMVHHPVFRSAQRPGETTAARAPARSSVPRCHGRTGVGSRCTGRRGAGSPRSPDCPGAGVRRRGSAGRTGAGAPPRP